MRIILISEAAVAQNKQRPNNGNAPDTTITQVMDTSLLGGKNLNPDIAIPSGYYSPNGDPNLITTNPRDNGENKIMRWTLGQDNIPSIDFKVGRLIGNSAVFYLGFITI